MVEQKNQKSEEVSEAEEKAVQSDEADLETAQDEAEETAGQVMCRTYLTI